jgi:hypothetical protein
MLFTVQHAGASVVFVDIGGNRQVETLVMLIPLLQSLLKPEVTAR